MIFPVKRVKEELIPVGIDRKELITFRAGGIEIVLSRQKKSNLMKS